MARPKKEVDAQLVQKLASINCTVEEIAACCKVSKDTLERRFAVYIKEGRLQGNASLKRKMWETAMNGNVTMMIWLSKQMLGYSEHVVVDEEEKIYTPPESMRE